MDGLPDPRPHPDPVPAPPISADVEFKRVRFDLLWK